MLAPDHRDPVSVLIEESDALARISAHRELALRAVQRQELSHALRHYEEAVLLDPQNEQLCARVQDLQGHLQAGSLGGKRKGMLRRLWASA